MTKQLISKRSIKSILSSCAFDPYRPLFKIAVANSDADYCIMRAQEYLEEARLTGNRDTLRQAIQSVVLALSFLEQTYGTQEPEVP